MNKKVEFSEVIAQIVAKDKKGAVGFLRSEGIKVSDNVSDKVLVRALMSGFKSTEYANTFKRWAVNRYQSKNTNSSKNKGFAKASGFDPSNVTSGSFDTEPYSNFLLNQEILDDAKSQQDQASQGGFFSGIDFGSLINTGATIWQQERSSNQTKALTNAQIRTEELKLEALKEQGKLNSQQFERQLALLQSGGGTSQDNTTLYVVGGVVVLVALVTTVFLITRKKK